LQQENLLKRGKMILDVIFVRNEISTIPTVRPLEIPWLTYWNGQKFDEVDCTWRLGAEFLKTM
jgi:hypothetical protein